jgi:hypothetical protein
MQAGPAVAVGSLATVENPGVHLGPLMQTHAPIHGHGWITRLGLTLQTWTRGFIC